MPAIPPMRAATRLGAALLLGSLLAGTPSGARAQEARSQTPQISTRQLAINFIVGRYVAPVRCTREDGTLIELQEALTVRQEASTVATTTGAHRLRATFFGIDIGGVTHCHNLMTPRLPDRRGVLNISFRGQTRDDLGTSYFRTELRDGEIEYHVQDGRMKTREIGSDAEPQTFEFDDDAQLVVRQLRPRSDPARMLERFAQKNGLSNQLPFELELVTKEGAFKLWVLKDLRADAAGHRAAGSRR